MLARLKLFFSRFTNWVQSIGKKQEIQPAPCPPVLQKVLDWMDGEEEVDPIDESVWESFPASDPPALTLENRN